jgi:putative RNA 2'-phosphotransferase
MDSHLVPKSKALSWLLRHGAAEAGLAMDDAGWADVAAVLRVLGMSRDDFVAVVRTNEKRRFELDAGNDRVRAAQGHSTGVPVDLDVLEASWIPFEGGDPIFHGTHRDALAGIAARGLVPQLRTHVHMVRERNSVAGKRANVDVLLVIDSGLVRQQGIRLFQSANGVVLARRVPRAAIVDVEPLTHRARLAERELRDVLGFGG